MVKRLWRAINWRLFPRRYWSPAEVEEINRRAREQWAAFQELID